MSKHVRVTLVGALLAVLGITSCSKPPYNNFEDDHRALRRAVKTGGLAAGIGAGIGTLAGGATGIGAAAGGVVGTVYGLYISNKAHLIETIENQDMRYVEYGDTMTLIVPTDRYFIVNTARFNDVYYGGLNNIARLLKYYTCTPIYVAGFTDDVGSHTHKQKLSQARAEAMVTFLWAHNIRAQRLNAEGYGDRYSVADNHFIHSSAFNRRLEIQWSRHVDCSVAKHESIVTDMK